MPTENSQSGPELIALKAARSLALHVLIAKKITDNPALLEKARANLERWGAAQGSGAAPRWLTEWQEILKRAWPEIAALITGQGQENDRLRKSAPFAGILTQEERLQIFNRFKAKATEAE